MFEDMGAGDFIERPDGLYLHKKTIDTLLDKFSDAADDILRFIRGPQLKWISQTYNLVTDEGETELLNRGYNGGTFTDYVGLTDGTPSFAEGDTMSSHAGWTEDQDYTEANRQDFVPGTAASQSLDNSSSPASFSINSDSNTTGGAFVTTDNTKGGTTGTLIGGAAFDAADKSLDSGDTLDVTITATAS